MKTEQNGKRPQGKNNSFKSKPIQKVYKNNNNNQKNIRQKQGFQQQRLKNKQNGHVNDKNSANQQTQQKQENSPENKNLSLKDKIKLLEQQRGQDEEMSKSKRKKLRRKQNKLVTQMEKKIQDENPYVPPANILKVAEKLYMEEAVQGVKGHKMNKQDEAWMKKIMISGTLKDRISAIQVYVKDNPKYSLPSLENLMKLCEEKNKKEALSAFACLKDLFISVLLGSSKLKSFSKNIQELGGEHTNEDLIDIYYESKVKDIYYRYIQLCINGLNDPQLFYKKQILEHMIELLTRKPENEELILSAIINKFGDSDKGLITQLNKSLSNLLMKHSRMVWIVIKEIQRFILRKNIKISSQFYAVNFINTLNMSKLAPENIKELISFLFTLFTKILENDNEELYSSKLLSQILRAVNKLFPITKQNYEDYKTFYNDKIDELFRLVNIANNFKIRIQTLLFIFQVQSHSNSLTDRYYRVLYELIQSNEMSGTSLHELFFDIMYFSLKTDFNLSRVKAFLKRLLQIAIHADPAFSITALIFISKILKIHPSLSTSFTHSEKFYLEEDDEEHFKDVKDSDDEDEEVEGQEEDQGQNGKQENATKKNQNLYDPYKREPLFANAQDSSLWEMNILAKHNHPTVNKFANDLLSGKDIIYKSNPLIDFTLANFLDRFSFKKSKKKETKGLQQLKAKGKLRMSKIEDELTVDNVMSKIKSNTMREEEKYFVKYFEEKKKKNDILGKQKKKKKQDEEAEEDEEEAELDEFVDELFESKLEKADIDDEDLDEEDLDYSDPEIDEDEGEEGQDMEYGGDYEEEEEDEEEAEDRRRQIEEEFEEDMDFDENLEEDLDQDDDEDDDDDDFTNLLDKAGHDEIEEIENFKQNKKLNKKQLEEEKRQQKRQQHPGKVNGKKVRGKVSKGSKKIKKGNRIKY